MENVRLLLKNLHQIFLGLNLKTQIRNHIYLFSDQMVKRLITLESMFPLLSVLMNLFGNKKLEIKKNNTQPTRKCIVLVV